MKIVIVSNLLTPHQIPLAWEFYKLIGEDFVFIETIDRSDDLPIGWRPQEETPPFLCTWRDFGSNPNRWEERIDQADVVILGSAPGRMLKKRLALKKLTFRYAERVYKAEPPFYQYPLRAIKYFWQFGRHKSYYLLCASAYTAGDYARTYTFRNRAFKWGYFPAKYEYDIGALMSQKERRTIVWAGRLLDWKHPEIAIKLAKCLREDGYEFSLDIIGTGPMEQALRDNISAEGLGDCVRLLGAMTPEKVRQYMEESEIFLFTSDRGEGWGAVLNEAMNSGCAVVASHAIGSVPFMIKDKENGLIYRDGDFEDFCKKAKWLLENPEERRRMGVAAYRTVEEEWNPENAAKRLIVLAEALLYDAGDHFPYKEGVLSKAEILKDEWYRATKDPMD